MDTHYENYDDTIEGKIIPKHCADGTYGHAIVTDFTENVYSQNIIRKHTFAENNWSFTRIGDDLIDSIEICGTCTDICVISNALALRSLYPKVPITVYSDCCAGTSKEAHEAALKVMESCLINVK